MQQPNRDNRAGGEGGGGGGRGGKKREEEEEEGRETMASLAVCLIHSPMQPPVNGRLGAQIYHLHHMTSLILFPW